MHRPVGSKIEVTGRDWLASEGLVSIGVTSGAPTPDNLVGAAIARLVECCGQACRSA